MPHRQVNGFTRLTIQFLQIRQAEAADVELSESGLPNCKARNSQSVNPISTAIQESRAVQIYQETVYRADREAGKSCDLLRS